jgi:hypothetical protein
MIAFGEEHADIMALKNAHRRAALLDAGAVEQESSASDGDAHGFVDRILAEQGRSRRIALTVPNFMFALGIIAETDLISALPRRFAVMHGPRFGVVGLEAPLSLGRFRLNAAAPKVAMMDMGLAWLFDVLGRAEQAVQQALKCSSRDIDV